MHKGNLIVTTKKVQIVRLAILAVSFPFSISSDLLLEQSGGLSPGKLHLLRIAFLSLWHPADCLSRCRYFDGLEEPIVLCSGI